MEIRLISFSEKGYDTAAKISSRLSHLQKNRYDCIPYALEKYVKDDNARPLTYGLDEWSRKGFAEADALVFVCACGIAVRAIAPHVKDKTKDPAVIVVDELGHHVIPILSGHLGGANMLAEEIAELIGSQAVITTATDINKKFSVDTFAKNNDLYITDMVKAKEISSAVLKGEKIGFICEYDIEGNIPEELELAASGAEYDKNIRIGNSSEEDGCFLDLIPKQYALGMGCRKGKSFQEIEAMALKAAEDAGITMDDICTLASIDLKKDETGFRELCKKYRIKSRFFSAEDLAGIPGEFSSSDFVSGVTGVDNVCERAAVAASDGYLVLSKQSAKGVTAAIAKRDEKELKIRFE